MRKGVLTSFDEPTDEELCFIMQEVAEEAKKKEASSIIMMQQRISKEIALAHANFKRKH